MLSLHKQKIQVVLLLLILVFAEGARSIPASAQTEENEFTLELPTGDEMPGDIPGLGNTSVDQVPGLADQTIFDIPALSDFNLGSIPGLGAISFAEAQEFLGSLSELEQLSGVADLSKYANYSLNDIPGLKDLKLNELPGLKFTQIKNVPGLNKVALKEVPGLKNMKIGEIPGLKDKPFNQIPGLKNVPGLKDIPGINSVPLSGLKNFFSSIQTLYGGTITKKSLKMCIISYFPPVMFPLQYVEVQNLDGSIAKLYRLFFISKIYKRNRLEKTSLAIGNALPGAQAFKAICRKKPKPPDANGIIWKIGTSCKAGENPGGKCKR